MKTIFEKWWCNETYLFSIINYKDSWSKNGTGRIFKFSTNGAKKRNGDNVLDVQLTIGYTVINFVNWDLQNAWRNNVHNNAPMNDIVEAKPLASQPKND